MFIMVKVVDINPHYQNRVINPQDQNKTKTSALKIKTKTSDSPSLLSLLVWRSLRKTSLRSAMTLPLPVAIVLHVDFSFSLLYCGIFFCKISK